MATRCFSPVIGFTCVIEQYDIAEIARNDQRDDQPSLE